MASNVGSKHKQWMQLQRLNKPVAEFDPAPAEFVDVFSPFRGDVEPTGGSEIIDGQKVESNITHVVRMRWKPDVRSSWRVRLIPSNRILEIASIVDWKDRKQYLICKCIERPALVEASTGLELNGWIWEDETDHIWEDASPAIWEV